MISIDAGLFFVICLGLLGLMFLASGVGWILGRTSRHYPEFSDVDERAYLDALAKVSRACPWRPEAPSRRGPDPRRRVRLERE